MAARKNNTVGPNLQRLRARCAERSWWAGERDALRDAVWDGVKDVGWDVVQDVGWGAVRGAV